MNADVEGGQRVGQSAGVVALLFTDLVGSTEVLDRMGDDAAEELRRTHFSLLRKAVAECGGTEVKSLGDGLMVAFTSPVRALECAVKMQEGIAEHNRARPGQALQVRVGVHAGEPLQDADDYHGSAVVAAKRLCDQARGGQILASEVVTGLVGRRGEFRLRPLGRLKLKGLAEPMPAVAVDWRAGLSPSPSRPRAASLPRRSLVGRDDQLARIERALNEAAGGHGQIVFVVGEMGMGKTALAEEALARARDGGCLVLVGRTPSAGSGLAYAPLLSAFGSVLRAVEPLRRDTLVGDLPHLGRLWPELGLPPPAPLQDPDLERALLFEAVARLVERLAAEAPLVLFVDDLHWADASSLALLGYLMPGFTDLPVLLLGAYRPEGVAESRGLRQLVTNAARSGLAVEVPVRGLEPHEVAALAAGLLGDAPPPSLLELSARAAGTPLFVEALVRGLIDAGTLVRSESGWELARDQEALPRGVRDLVVDRLDLLAPKERAVVNLIAHGAQGLTHDVLESAAGFGPDELVRVVGGLVTGGLAVQESDGRDITYRLSHPLVEEVAAASLPAVAGRRIHALLANTIERLRPRDLDRIAYHYSRAGGEVNAERAIDVLLEAGERAHGLSAHDEAARHFAAVLPWLREGRRPELLAPVLERLGESWEPIGETAVAIEVWTEAVGEAERLGDVLGVARLCRRLGLAARILGDADAARRHLAAGVEALRELPPSEELVDLHHARLLVDSPLFDPERATHSVAELSRLARVLGSPRTAMESLSGEGSLHLARGDFGLARAKAEEALHIAKETGDLSLILRAHRDLAWVTWFMGDHEGLRAHAEAQFELARRLGAPALECMARFQFALLDIYTAKLDQVFQEGEQAVAQARRYGQRRILIMALGTLAMAHAIRGDLDRGEESLAEARQAGRIMGGDRALHLLWISEAMLALERGDAAAAMAAAAPLRAPAARVLMGTAQVLAGDLDEAFTTAGDLATKGPPGSSSAALGDRVFGLVAKARGDEETAREHLERSAEALEALGWPFEAALSRLHAGNAESVARALATFDAVGAARYADRARRELRALGVRVPTSRRGGAGPLSRREVEVARLVAERLTNAEIAERLVVSVRTVESHLDHIYSRLDISSRAELARWVSDNGLT